VYTAPSLSLGNKAPKTNKQRAVNRRASQKKSPTTWIDQEIVNTHHSSVSSRIASMRSDLTLRPPSNLINQRPPSNYRSSIFWTEFTFDQQMTIPASSAFNGLGISNKFSDDARASQVATNFDQYCIYAVAVRMTLAASNTTFANSLSSGRIATAIDFDSDANPASFTALQNYNNCMEDTLSYGMSYERFYKPCVNSNVFALTGSAFANSRSWIDSVNLTVPHYGFKVGVDGYPGATSIVLLITTTMVCGFRNSL
jgi:hypothetical protein